VSPLADWLDRHTRDAPPALRARVLEHALATPSSPDVPGMLALAGRATLERVTAHPGDRSVALDLLAADALITLALLAQAQRAPQDLAGFAASVLQAVRPGT
jgi:hypothetical protein